MDRQQAISTIEALYPIDSQYKETTAIGERLLAQAKRECEDWRNLPDAILLRYANLAGLHDARQSVMKLLGSPYPLPPVQAIKP